MYKINSVNLEDRIADNSEWSVVGKLWQSEDVNAPFANRANHLYQCTDHMRQTKLKLIDHLCIERPLITDKQTIPMDW